MITGLESDYYCAHNPIPVEVSGMTSSNAMTLQIYIDDVPMIVHPPVYYSINGVFKIDLSAWVRQYMARLREEETYTDVPEIIEQEYVREMRIEFNVGSQSEDIERRFVHCALQSYTLSPFEDDCCIKVWKCYPFSAPAAGWDNRVLFIPTTDIEPDLDICGCVDYDISCCEGTYVKWLNAKGYYSYWLFPKHSTIIREGEEIFRVPRNVFDTDRTSNEQTAGFDVTESIQVRDKIPAPYWDQLKTLIGSPEVYILNPLWELGSTEATPADWIRVIQDGPEFERNTRNNVADFEITLNLPKVYTQKLI